MTAPPRALLLALLTTAAAAGGLSAQHELYVTFLHTSDEHSSLLPMPLVEHHGHGAARGGFARLATAVETLRERARAAGEPVLLTSAGDNLAGTPFAWLALDGAGTELGLMVELGYDAVTLGNHEFDYDAERLARYIAAAGFPAAAARTALLATNTRPPSGHPLGRLGIRRTFVHELPNGLRVGMFGLIGRGAARFATLAAPVEFTDAVVEAAAAVAELRAAGADIIVALTHSGVAEDIELARTVPGIHIILGGHDHRLIERPLIEAGTLIVHPGAYTRQLFVLELAFDTAQRTLRTRNDERGTPYVHALDAGVTASPWMSARVAEASSRLESRVAVLTRARVNSLDQTVARAAFSLRAGPPLQETPLGNFVTDAMRAAVGASTGVTPDFAFQANGVIRGDLHTGTTRRPGDITFHDLASVVGMGVGPDGMPGYPLVSVWLTGEEVRRALEISVLLSELLRNSYYLQVSGLHVQYDPRRAILFRVPFRGTPIPTGRAVLRVQRSGPAGGVTLERGDDALYHVVTDYYVASFLPMVGRMLPRLALQPKTREGTPIDDIEAAIVLRDGRELKVWEAVLEYAAAQPAGADGLPRIADRYREAEGRLVLARGAPLWTAPLAFLLLLAGLSWWLVRRRASKPRVSPSSL